MTDTADPIDVSEVAPEPDPIPERESSTALLAAEPEAVAAYLPVPAEWQIILQQADVLAASDLVPTAYRRKPANVVLATLAGRPFGWDASMAMRSFHIIEGMPTMKPEIMLALIRKAGHSVAGESAWDHATVTGTRRDTGESMTTGFTVHDAVRAGLCTLDDNGQPFARTDRGKPLPWEQYPESMCWARAISKLARMLFSDVVLGAGYVPEEFGTYVGDDGAVIDVGEVPTWAQPEPPPIPIDKELARQLKWRAQHLPEEAAGLLRKQLYERDLTGAISAQAASKAALITGLIAAMEKRAEAAEWGPWEATPCPDPLRHPTDEDLATAYNDPGFDDRPPDLERAVAEAKEARARHPEPEDTETPEGAAARQASDAAAILAMADQSGDPFAPTDNDPASGAEVAQVDIPALNLADIATMRKIPAVEHLAARGLPTAGTVEVCRQRLHDYEAARAMAAPTAG